MMEEGLPCKILNRSWSARIFIFLLGSPYSIKLSNFSSCFLVNTGFSSLSGISFSQVLNGKFSSFKISYSSSLGWTRSPQDSRKSWTVCLRFIWSSITGVRGSWLWMGKPEVTMILRLLHCSLRDSKSLRNSSSWSFYIRALQLSRQSKNC